MGAVGLTSRLLTENLSFVIAAHQLGKPGTSEGALVANVFKELQRLMDVQVGKVFQLETVRRYLLLQFDKHHYLFHLLIVECCLLRHRRHV